MALERIDVQAGALSFAERPVDRTFWRVVLTNAKRRAKEQRICWTVDEWQAWLDAAKAAGYTFGENVGRIEAYLNSDMTDEQIRHETVLLQQRQRALEAEAETKARAAAAQAKRDGLIRAELQRLEEQRLVKDAQSAARAMFNQLHGEDAASSTAPPRRRRPAGAE